MALCGKSLQGFGSGALTPNAGLKIKCVVIIEPQIRCVVLNADLTCEIRREVWLFTQLPQQKVYCCLSIFWRQIRNAEELV